MFYGRINRKHALKADRTKYHWEDISEVIVMDKQNSFKQLDFEPVMKQST